MSRTIRNTTSRDYALRREMRDHDARYNVETRNGRVMRAQRFGLTVRSDGSIVTRNGTVVAHIHD